MTEKTEADPKGAGEICWIETIAEADADALLAGIYDQVRSANGQLDNLYQGFSLRAHTIKPADDLYLAAMHNDSNSLPKWFSELIGTYVAILNGCVYAETHHGANYRYLVDARVDPEQVLKDLRSNQLENCGDEREIAALGYVRQLVLQPESISRECVLTLQQSGWSDGEILEIVQIVAMFSYFVRVINGIGIQLGNEKHGLYDQ